MAKQKKRWAYTPPKKSKSKVPETLKAELAEKAKKLIEVTFKPYRLKLDENAKEHGWNYVVEMYTKWWRNYFYFCSKYHCPSPHALSEYFDECFTRMEYVGGRQFNLAYKRHTEQWWEVFQELTVEECFEMIEGNQIFWP